MEALAHTPEAQAYLEQLKLKRIPARIFLQMGIEEMWDMLTGEFILVFDDGEITTNDRETLYSAYAWEFHRTYPNTPLLMKHHLRHILKGKRLGSDTHLELLGNAMWSVYDHYIKATPEPMRFRDQLSEMVYRLTNRMYNDLSYRLEEYVSSLDILDFIEVLEHPEVKEANLAAQSLTPAELADRKLGQAAINHAYSAIDKVLRTPGIFPNNPIALSTQSKLVSDGQVRQCLGPRGYLTDTDSNMFNIPVMRGYAQGLRSLYNSLVESRSAAKSLLFSKTPLQQAEYFSRRLQLMSQIVRNLHGGDCGSQSYLEWKIRPEYKDNGKVVRLSDLKFMEGKVYLDESTGLLKTLRSSDKHLENQVVKFRSVIYCQHPDPYGVCTTCFGELSLSVPESTNLGHMCCTSMTQKSSQMVLSVKHLDGSSEVESIEISENDRKYLMPSKDDISYMMAPRLKNKAVTLVIPHERAQNITDILEAKNVEDLNITHVAELEHVGFVVAESDKLPPIKAMCHVHMGRRLSSMTYQLLAYIKQNGWGVDENHNYTIDLSYWDWDQPLLQLPLKHINMSDHSRDIAQMLESRVEDMHTRDKGISPDQFLVELFDLVNDKLNVNLAVLEVILYATMIRSAERFDYALPKPYTTRGLGVMKNSMAYRSLAAAMAYEGHHDIITSPYSYVLRNRPDHPMDGILMPGEVFHGAQR